MFIPFGFFVSFCFFAISLSRLQLLYVFESVLYCFEFVCFSFLMSANDFLLEVRCCLVRSWAWRIDPLGRKACASLFLYAGIRSQSNEKRMRRFVPMCLNCKLFGFVRACGRGEAVWTRGRSIPDAGGKFEKFSCDSAASCSAASSRFIEQCK